MGTSQELQLWALLLLYAGHVSKRLEPTPEESRQIMVCINPRDVMLMGFLSTCQGLTSELHAKPKRSFCR
jgi:hypothetical protein